LEQLRALPVSSNGVSLVSMRDTAKRLGVETEIRRYRVEDIDSLPLPAIAPFKTSDVSVTPLHFDVIYRLDANYIYLLNGTTGAEESIYRPKLQNFWTGVALSQKRPRINKTTAMIFLGVFLTITDLAIVASWIGKLPGARKHRVAGNNVVRA
jgi:ABC-type bacteriocin/lantibiotic exporter with double-glycine peptidase domain